MRAAFALIFLLFSAVVSDAAASEPQVAPVVEIGDKQGYLVLDLNLQRDVSKIEIRALRVTQSSRKRASRKKFEFGPFKAGRYIQLIPLTQGEYRWEATSVPHFDLPYRLGSEDDERWEFTIAAGRTNYIGQLNVLAERETDSVRAALPSRIAQTYGDLTEFYGAVIAQYPLRNAGIYRDSFFETFLPSTTLLSQSE